MKWTSIARLRATAVLSILPLLTLMVFAAGDSDKTLVRVHDRTRAAATPDRHVNRGDYLVREALSYRGVPYRFGGTSRSGIDCSALIQEAGRHWGLLLPRTAVQQFYQGQVIAKDRLRPGDLVFFRGTYRKGISHVGIYAGEGKIVHASSRHAGVIVSLLADPYLQNHYAGARRLNLDKLPKPTPASAPTLQNYDSNAEATLSEQAAGN